MLLTQDINGEDVNDLSMPIQNGSSTAYRNKLWEKFQREAKCQAPHTAQCGEKGRA
jgi:hypothetical protein